MKSIEDLITFYNCAMVVMIESIILCTCIIETLVYESAAYDVNKNICLETVKRVIRWPNRCNLNSAEMSLQDAETCPSKCNVHIDNLGYRNTFSLRQVNITIGTEQPLKWSFCTSSQMTSIYMHIDCSSWNKDKYKVIYYYNYPFGNADCVDINNYKICHCYDGYSIVNGQCLKGNIVLGDSCVYDGQCTGTANANSCRSWKCTCQTGYILIDNYCYRGNIVLGDSCVYDGQCTGTANANSCRSWKCTCQTGYILIDNYCYRGNIVLGDSCVYDGQCTGTANANSCRSWKCTCQTGYTLIDNKCYEGNITVDNSCSYDWQCTGTQLASSCKYDVCTCYTGYILIDNNCYQDHVPVGGFCSLDKQCTGSNYSETCKDRRCQCSDGHLLLDLECIQGNLSLNQSCTVHEQCSSSNYSRCIEEKCTCMEGYTAENLTHCIKFQPNEFEHSVRNPHDNNIGKILGTLFGGIFIGFILTAAIVVLMFKKMQTKIKKREEPSVSFANDVIYSSAIVVERKDITGSQANEKKRKVVNVLPYACSGKGEVYSFVNRKPIIEQPTTEGVYNHLREQEKHDNEHDDNYDHACAASYLGTEPSVYSNMP